MHLLIWCVIKIGKHKFYLRPLYIKSRAIVGLDENPVLWPPHAKS